MQTVLLLFFSNIFMTFAWYGSLKYPQLATWKAVILSWCLAFFEYSLMIPANRDGYLSGTFSATQLKILQEAITIFVFVLFSMLYLREHLRWNYVVSFLLVLLAVFFAFKKFD